jgi:hypothetical protein
MDTCVCQPLAYLLRFRELSVTLIVAMSMEKHFVAQVVVVAVSIEMIDLHDVSILEVQFTPATFALLFLKQSRFRLMQQWMSLEALAPVQRVPIIRTGPSLHFGVSLDVGLTVRAQFCVLGSCKHPFALPYAMPVFVDHKAEFLSRAVWLLPSSSAVPTIHGHSI